MERDAFLPSFFRIAIQVGLDKGRQGVVVPSNNLG